MAGLACIGILDIYGFESLETNSFEQLLINYANEKLQKNFTLTIFENEEGLYTSEGITFDHIPYIDNQPVLDLLESPPKEKNGILMMLDEEAKLSGEAGTYLYYSVEHTPDSIEKKLALGS